MSVVRVQRMTRYSLVRDAAVAAFGNENVLALLHELHTVDRELGVDLVGAERGGASHVDHAVGYGPDDLHLTRRQGGGVDVAATMRNSTTCPGSALVAALKRSCGCPSSPVTTLTMYVSLCSDIWLADSCAVTVPKRAMSDSASSAPSSLRAPVRE